MTPFIDAAQCIECNACADNCPDGAIHMVRNGYEIDTESCTECAGESPRCVEHCPTNSVVLRTQIDLEQLDI